MINFLTTGEMKIQHTISGLFLSIVLLFVTVGLQAAVTQNFESGNRTTERGNCWQFTNSSISGSNRISGSYSGYTSTLNHTNNPGIFISPWIDFTVNDVVSFSHKISSVNGSTHQYLYVTLIDLDGNSTEIFNFTYSNNQAVSQELLINVSGTYQVQWLYTTTGGGGSHGVLDNIDISGDYMADPTNNPNGSGNCAALIPINDADGDGVTDDLDDYPTDPLKAFNLYTPAEGFGTLTFEDMWPNMGDYDFNDLVIKYRFNQIANSDNEIVEIAVTFVPQAVGAGFANGFAFMLPVPVSSVSSVSGSFITEDYITLSSNGLEAGQQNAVVVVLDNSKTVFTGISGTNPTGFAGINTCLGGVTGTGTEIQILVSFNSPVSMQTLGLPPYNPFLIVNGQRGNEIHLADMPPTNLADASLFGTGKDNSDPSQGRYYKTINNLPWALNVSETFDNPIEKAQITEGYLKFNEWAVSGGNNYPGWFHNQSGYRNPSKIFTQP